MNDIQMIAKALDGLTSIQAHLVGLNQETVSLANKILAHPTFKRFQSANTDRCCIDFTSLEVKAAITGTLAANDPLSPSYKPAIDPGARRALQVRELLPSFPTQNSAIEMPIKDTAVTGSPIMQNGENTMMGESGYTFSTSFVPIETIGHWVPVSKQIFEDAGSLDGLINTELLHGLGLNVQNQIINGDGTGHQLYGLLDSASTWNNESPNIANEADIVRSAMKQIENADFNANGVILNCNDWYDIETRKASGSDDTYTAGAPCLTGSDEAKVWRLPVVSTPAIPSGSFLVADFNRCAILFDRQKPQIEISRHNGNNFEKGMLTIRATERLALVITNPTAMVKGSL